MNHKQCCIRRMMWGVMSMALMLVLGIPPVNSHNHKKDDSQSTCHHTEVCVKISGKILLPKDEFEERFTIVFLPFKRPEYEAYSHEIARLLNLREKVRKNLYSVDDYSEKFDALVHKIDRELVERRDQKTARYYSVKIHASTFEQPFTIQVEKGHYLVYIFQKGTVYLKTLEIPDSINLELEKKDLFFSYLPIDY